MRVKCLLLVFSSLSIVRANDVITGINLIANEKYRHDRTPHVNNIFSPLTMHSALSLLYEGASGETEVALGEILHLTSKQQTAREYNEMKFARNNVNLGIGHKLFIRLKDSLRNTYESVLKNDFQGEVGKVDFSEKEGAAREIRKWIEWITDGKIGTVVIPWELQSSTRAILMSVIYFKGEWGEDVHFAKNGVFTDKFHKVPSNCSFVQTTGLFSLTDSRKLDAKILKLPYLNDRYSMVIVLPNTPYGINKLHNDLASVSITPYLKDFDKVLVKVVIPKFRYDQFNNLTSIARKMGLAEIFRNGANFSQMLDSPEEFYLSEIQQRISIEVDETGSVGAASTDNKLHVRGHPKLFQVNRPFVFIITACVDVGNNQTNDVALFMGNVYRPEW